MGSAFDRAGIEEFAVTSYTADSIDALRDACITYFLNNGCEMVSYHHLPPPGASDYSSNITVATYGFPEDWVEAYVSEKLYDIDPIPKRALNATMPFWWSEIRHQPDLGVDELTYLDRLAAADFGDGLAVPVFGPHGRNGYAGIGFGKRGVALSLIDMATIHWACQLGHQRYCDLLRSQAPNGISLSKRETEILEWVARGKSNSVIADITGLSTYTVDTYLRRIYGKMDVSDRVTAALRGMAIGLVT